MVDDYLKSILNDTTSGSTEILEKIIHYFLDNPNNITKKNIDSISEKFGHFQIVVGLISEIKQITNSGTTNSIKILLNDYLSRKTKNLNSLFKNALVYLKGVDSILSISNSRTLDYVFNEYYSVNKNLCMTILESRPNLEGRLLAESYAANGIPVKFITEAMSADFIENCDAAVIGADKILRNGDVINKTGSRNLAILAKYFEKPLFVLADKSKISNDNDFNCPTQNPNEIWKCNFKNISVINYYFEKIESSLITKIITN